MNSGLRATKVSAAQAAGVVTPQDFQASIVPLAALAGATEGPVFAPEPKPEVPPPQPPPAPPQGSGGGPVFVPSPPPPPPPPPPPTDYHVVTEQSAVIIEKPIAKMKEVLFDGNWKPPAQGTTKYVASSTALVTFVFDDANKTRQTVQVSAGGYVDKVAGAYVISKN